MKTRANHVVALATAVLIGVLAAAPTQAGLVPEAKASIAPRSEVQSIGDGEVYIFTAPPREDVQAGRRLYEPIADYLSRATGKRFVYQHPGNWLTYQDWIWSDHGHVYFDGPHFVSFRLGQMQHTLGPSLPQSLHWQVITRHDNAKIKDLKDLRGHTFCTHAPPNFGTLYAQSLFTNPMRVFYPLNTKGWANIYKRVVAGECAGGVLPSTNLDKLDPQREQVRVLHTGPSFPNQAFTISPRVPAVLVAQINAALASPEGQLASQRLRERFSGGRELVLGERHRYQGIDKLVTDFWNLVYAPVIQRHLEQHRTRLSMSAR